MEEKMHQRRLSPEQGRFILDLKGIGISNTEVAEKLGITEGAVRYRIKRQESGAQDGRRHKFSSLNTYHEFIHTWIDDYKDSSHRPTLKALFNLLKGYHNYRASYDALRRYVRKHFPEFAKKGARIRIETPPGVLMQIDWKEDVAVQLGAPGNWIKVHALVFSLSFSRKTVVILSSDRTLSSFINAHQRAFSLFGGLPQYIRPDCLRSAILKWRGARSLLNERYKKYMNDLGIEVFPSRPGTPTDKGKVEKRIGDLFKRLNLRHAIFQNLADLQGYVDGELFIAEQNWSCGATGLRVPESFAYEKRYLKSLPESFPELPVKEQRTRVRRDGTVWFAGNYYQVPGVYTDKVVLCLHSGLEIRIYHAGEEIERYPFLPGVKGMVRLTEKALTDDALQLSPRVRGWALEVARRQVDIYHELLGGIVG
jgi:transposase